MPITRLTIFLSAAALALLAVPASAQLRDGIVVRGHWVLTVTNADGSVASRTEFDNALTDYGNLVLSHLLLSPMGSNQTNPPIFVEAWQVKAWMVSNGEDRQLTFNVSSDRHYQGVELTGRWERSPYAGEIRQVSTQIWLNGLLASPLSREGTFSATSTPPTSIAIGQALDVKVTITFAAAPHTPNY